MAEIVQTVLGGVAPPSLGYTLTHEHLAMEFTKLYCAPPAHLADKFKHGFSLDKVGFIKQFPYSSHDNLLLSDEGSARAVLNDVKEFKRCGGGTIVENSTVGLKANVPFYKQVSQQTGVHVVAGTGYYVEDLQPAGSEGKIEEFYDHMMRELTEGCEGDPTVKAGFIGEIASVYPIRDFERRVIRASGELQPQLGCGVSFHPHRDPAAPAEIVRLYLEAGGDKSKCVMSHLDRTLLKDDDLLSFSDLGVYCQLDLFGVETSLYQLNMTTDMPSDAQRIDKVKLLVDEGKEDRVLMSHDIHTKHRLIDYGGHGYSHILNTVIPKMKVKGFTQETIDKITIENPARWLASGNT